MIKSKKKLFGKALASALAASFSVCAVFGGVLTTYASDCNHGFANTWSNDSVNHWHASTCGHNIISDAEPHNFVNGKCSVCNASQLTQEHVHTYNLQWESDGKNHWRASTCEHNIVKDMAAHTYVNGKCSACGTSQGQLPIDPGPVDPEPPVVAGSVNITEAVGDLESAYVKWSPLEGANWYNVYYKSVGGSWIKLDAPLVRQYKTYFRADAVGLKAGNYQMKVVPRDSSGKELEEKSAAKNVIVAAHERTGYAFIGADGQRVMPGTYNEDGTLKDGVRVLYVTDENKDSIELDVITNKNGSTTACKGLQEIFNSYAKGLDKNPICLRIIGNINPPSVLNKGDFQVCNGTDSVKGGAVTIEGIGSDATINGFGIVISRGSMFEIRNLGFMNCNMGGFDNIGIQQSSDHIWVHNCDMFYGKGTDADQAKGDGALDTKKSSYVTHSYNHFWDSGKCNLQGMKDPSEADALVTYHHNWYDHSDSRHPRVRAGTIHVYNNYYDGVAKYGVGATTGSSVFVENNYFRSTANLKPMLIAGQGTDVAETSKGTFSGETGGFIKAYGNKFDCTKITMVTQKNTADKTAIDCYEASSRYEKVPAEYTTLKGGNKYNNFDTAQDMYDYTPDTPEAARDKVMKYAGRIGGGDVKFVFNNTVEDANYSIIPELKKLLTEYTSDLLKIGKD